QAVLPLASRCSASLSLSLSAFLPFCVSASLRLCVSPCALNRGSLAHLDARGFVVRLLAQEFDPLFLERRIMLRSLDQVDKAINRRLEPGLQLVVGNASGVVERVMCLRQREHVGIEPRAEVLEWLA